MKYTIVLTGNKVVEVDQETRDVVDRAWKSKAQSVIMIGNNTVRVDTIRGIFERKDDFRIGENTVADRVHNEFYADCERGADMSVKEKVSRELTTRIFPEAFLSIGYIRDVDRLTDKLKPVLTDFFTSNPRWPRCPAKYWFPIISGKLSKKTASFYRFVAKNDGEIYYWVKRNRIGEKPVQKGLV